MRRSRPTINRDEGYNEASSRVTALKRRVYYTIPVGFTLEEFIDEGLSKEYQKLLANVKRLAKTPYDQCISVSLEGTGVNIRYDFENTTMFPPQFMNFPDDGKVMKFARAVAGVFAEFSCVDKALVWCREQGKSFAVVRYYWPTVMGLLPPTHKIHEAGTIFKEPDKVAAMIPVFREATTVVTSATLLPDSPEEERNQKLTIYINGLTLPVL